MKALNELSVWESNIVNNRQQTVITLIAFLCIYVLLCAKDSEIQ